MSESAGMLVLTRVLHGASVILGLANYFPFIQTVDLPRSKENLKEIIIGKINEVALLGTEGLLQHLDER